MTLRTGWNRLGRCRLLIALAILGIALPPWPASGPASQLAAAHSSRLARSLPKEATAALRWLSRLAGLHPTPTLAATARIEAPNPDEDETSTPERDGEQDEVPSDAEDLAEPGARQVVLASRRTQERREGWSTPSRSRLAGPPGSDATDRLRTWRLAQLDPSPTDLPTSLCRLTC